MQPQITAKFTLSLADFAVYCQLQRKLSMVRRYSNVFLFGVDAICVVVGFLVDIRILWLFGISHGVVWIIWLTFGKPWQIKRSFRQQHLGEHESRLEVSDDGINFDSIGVKADFNWRVFRSLDESDEHFVLWINRLQGICIPKRAFANDTDLTTFKELARAKTAGKTLG